MNKLNLEDLQLLEKIVSDNLFPFYVTDVLTPWKRKMMKINGLFPIRNNCCGMLNIVGLFMRFG